MMSHCTAVCPQVLLSAVEHIQELALVLHQQLGKQRSREARRASSGLAPALPLSCSPPLLLSPVPLFPCTPVILLPCCCSSCMPPSPGQATPSSSPARTQLPLDCSSAALAPHPGAASLASTHPSLGVQQVLEGTVMEGSSTVQEAGTEGSSTVLDLLHQQLEEVTELEKRRTSQGQVGA